MLSTLDLGEPDHNKRQKTHYDLAKFLLAQKRRISMADNKMNSGSKNQISDWWSMRADRRGLATGLALFTFIVLIFLGVLFPTQIQQAVANSDPIETLFNALIGGIITGVTLVLTINQLVLSQELGAVDDQKQRMEGAMDFIHEVESMLDRTPSPAEPAAFMKTLIGAIRKKATALADSVSDSSAGNTDVGKKIEDYTEMVQERAQTVEQKLDGTEFGTFGLIFTALQFNYSAMIHEGRQLYNEEMEQLADPSKSQLEELIKLLKSFGPAREHIKTLYFQWEFINLSKAIIYTGLPALLISCMVPLYLGELRTISGQTLGINNLFLTVSLATTLALSPFLVMISYLLRIATVAKRTLAMGPFILRERS
jgi:hypothetical protein